MKKNIYEYQGVIPNEKEKLRFSIMLGLIFMLSLTSLIINLF